MTRSQRGMTLIEVLMAVAIMTFGLLGLASLQIVSVQSTSYATRLQQASEMARDLADQMQLWSYSDTRLNTTVGNQNDTNTTVISAGWDPGRGDTCSTTYQYAEQAGEAGCAATSAALGAYKGLTSPMTAGTTAPTALYHRYWSVFPIDLAGTGAPQGKLVQIVVRWRDNGGLGGGWRNVTTSAYIINPAAVAQ